MPGHCRERFNIAITLLASLGAVVLGASIPLALDLDVSLHIPEAHENAVAVLIPFRSWHRTLEHALDAIPHCIGNRLNYTLFVVEQVDGTPFNKGLLLNAGYREIKRISGDAFKYVMIHDVDTVCDRTEASLLLFMTHTMYESE